MTELAQHCFNAICQDWSAQKIQAIPAENQLAQQYGVSRTLIREVLGHMAHKGILAFNGRQKKLLRLPKSNDHLKLKSGTKSKVENIYDQLLELFRRGTFQPGESFSELELSKQFNTTTGTIREALLKIESFYFIHKQARQRWQIIRCDDQHLQQALDFRRLIERHACEKFCLLPENSSHWMDLDQLEIEHHQLASQQNVPVRDWLKLDEKFHISLVAASQNAYLLQAIQGLSLLIHLQYAHLKDDMASLRDSLGHHISIIQALRKRNLKRCWNVFDAHLALAKTRLKERERPSSI